MTMLLFRTLQSTTIAKIHPIGSWDFQRHVSLTAITGLAPSGELSYWYISCIRGIFGLIMIFWPSISMLRYKARCLEANFSSQPPSFTPKPLPPGLNFLRPVLRYGTIRRSDGVFCVDSKGANPRKALVKGYTDCMYIVGCPPSPVMAKVLSCNPLLKMSYSIGRDYYWERGIT